MLLAAIELTPELQIAIAGIVTAVLAGYGNSQRKATKKLGDPNGHGSIAALIEDVLERVKHVERTTTKTNADVAELKALAHRHDETPTSKGGGSYPVKVI